MNKCNVDVLRTETKIKINCQEFDKDLLYKEDVDFTEFINYLVKMIDKNKACEFSYIGSSIAREKLTEHEGLIVNTIEQIVDKFNNSLCYEEEQQGEDKSLDKADLEDAF